MISEPWKNPEYGNIQDPWPDPTRWAGFRAGSGLPLWLVGRGSGKKYEPDANTTIYEFIINAHFFKGFYFLISLNDECQHMSEDVSISACESTFSGCFTINDESVEIKKERINYRILSTEKEMFLPLRNAIIFFVLVLLWLVQKWTITTDIWWNSTFRLNKPTVTYSMQYHFDADITLTIFVYCIIDMLTFTSNLCIPSINSNSFQTCVLDKINVWCLAFWMKFLFVEWIYIYLSDSFSFSNVN